MANIISISDFKHPDLMFYSEIPEKQLLHYYEPAPGLFIAESPNVIERALTAGYEPVSFLVEEKYIFPTLYPFLSNFHTIPIYASSIDTLTRLTGYNLTKGMLCLMKRKEKKSVDKILNNSGKICILEDIVNPTNIGAIFRSAAALSIDAVLLTNNCSDPLYRRTSRVSMGTVFQIPWSYIKYDNYISYLKEHNYTTIAMALTESSIPLDNLSLGHSDKIAVILGNEGYGLSSSTIQASDYNICIPMSHGVDSLNVAAASTIAFWEISKL